MLAIFRFVARWICRYCGREFNSRFSLAGHLQVSLKSFLQDEGLVLSEWGDWILVERSVSFLYMSLLAKYLSIVESSNQEYVVPGTDNETLNVK
ncbi:MAG: hypothetical protein DRO23_10925 [Thermoprotei archaeon]|nr:MAG: hypothetical protein DRO23_10925 [Thermoprotei archaeon]